MIKRKQIYDTSLQRHRDLLKNKERLRQWHRFFAILPVPVNVNEEDNTCDRVYLQWVYRRAKTFTNESCREHGMPIDYGYRLSEDHVLEWEYKLIG